MSTQYVAKGLETEFAPLAKLTKKVRGPVAGTHGDVLNRHPEACWDLHTVCSPFF